MSADGAHGRAIIVMTAAVLFAAAPLAVGGFGGFDPAVFPVPQVDPAIQPAGWAFSIWGLIYVWILGHAGFGLVKRGDAPDWDRTRVPMIVVLVLGTVWIPVAQRDPVIATILIGLMLIAAVIAFLRAPRPDWPWGAGPVGLLAGWLTAATGVSIGLLVAGHGLAGPLVASIGALVWTLALAGVIVALRPDPAFALAVGWALLGIVARNGMAQPAISVLAAAGMIALPALALWRRAGGA